MITSAVICEYNPFHNGHKYLNEQIKQNYADAIVAVMSTSFTQRGDVAVFDKYLRAEAALKNGADLVVELPVVYSVSSAETFAKSGVKIAENLSLNMLCFGSESSLDSVLKASKALTDKKSENNIKKYLSLGNSYPSAQQKALEEIYGKELANIINTPNNILGIEYCKALLNTTIKPIAIKRYGVSHDSSKCFENYASASKIRQMIYNNEDFSAYFPPNLKELYKANYKSYASINNLEKILLYKLRTMTNADFKKLPDVNEGLENRIVSCVAESKSICELLEKLKTKRYTMARLRRILIFALLDITKDLQSTTTPYIKVLGLNSKGAEILKSAKKVSDIPIITKTSLGYQKLSNNAKKVFDKEVLAGNIYSLATNNISTCNTDFYKNPIVF